jgi:enamine deaminase RidA (YjgF/YER057c/UK114 family)
LSTNPHERLAELGYELPRVNPPAGAYVPAVRVGNLVYVSGQVPMVDGKLVTTGKVGTDVTVQEARELAQRCALSALAAVHYAAGLEKITRVVKVGGFVASAKGFEDQPSVIDGASEFLVAVFGDAGRHARTSVGVAELPLGSPVEVELIVEVSD